MYDRATRIEDFLSATSIKQPIPGGGSVAALAGALSAAIGEMVLSYSIGKKDLIPFDPILKHVAHELQTAREVLLKLMVEDQEAYAELTAVRKLPADSSDRAARLPIAVLACIRCPQAVGATAVAVLKLCDQVVEIVNPWLLSDLAVSADLAMATARAAGYNVRVNLSSIENAAERKRLEEETDAMLSHAKALIQHVSPLIWWRYDAATRK
jgi:formiminotetrahydrofolate cyclodeaminase